MRGEIAVSTVDECKQSRRYDAEKTTFIQLLLALGSEGRGNTVGNSSSGDRPGRLDHRHAAHMST